MTETVDCSSCESFRSEIKWLSLELFKVQSSNASCQAALLESREDLADLQKDLFQQKKRVAELEMRDESAARITELERKVKNSQYVIDELNEWVGRLQDRIADLTL